MGFLWVFLIILLISIALIVTSYILRSIALYKLAARRGLSNPGLAWIPIVGAFRAGTIADDINAREGSRTHLGKILLGGYIFSYVSSMMLNRYLSFASFSAFDEFLSDSYSYGSDFGSFLFRRWANPAVTLFSSLGALVGLASYVFLVIALHKLYKTYRPRSATAWTVLSAIPFTAFLQPFFLFAIRNAEPVQEWSARGYYPPGPPPPPVMPQGIPVYMRPDWQPEPPSAPPPPPWHPDPPRESPPQPPDYPEQ
jgi:hypothetical protein